jgi:predicted Zn-dependent protease
MSLKESREIKPLHVKIVTVRAHDTVAKLARRMAVSDHATSLFRVLNGLGPHDRVKPGEKVKIVE